MCGLVAAMAEHVFEVVEWPEDYENIAVGEQIRQIRELERRYGKGRWLKRKGMGKVRLADGSERRAELHWYEAHGIGKKRIKIKRFLQAER